MIEHETMLGIVATEAVEAIAGSQQRPCSGEADPLLSELRSLATTEHSLEMAVEAQQGKPIDAG